MQVSYSYYSGLGRRKNNEDAVQVLESASGVIAIVADGVGGQACGELASQQTVQTMVSRMAASGIHADVMKGAILAANEAIVQIQKKHPGSQTTLAALWLGEKYAIAMHVGDSRIYQFREGRIVFQSVDHSIAQLAVLNGDARPEDIRSHPDKNKLFRALGDPNTPRIAEQLLEILPGDRLLLCSDGFWEKILEEDMIKTAFSTDNAETWLEQMRAIAEPRATDNNTAIAIVIN